MKRKYPNQSPLNLGVNQYVETIDLIKGHMGGNEIILLYGDQIPEGKEMKLAQSILNEPSIGGDELGLFYKPERGGDLMVKIAERSVPHYIPMCGGLTQVLGIALIETNFAKHFNIKMEEPITEVTLETDVGLIQLKIDVRRKKVLTNMKAFVDKCYEWGVQKIKVADIDAMKVGGYLVVNGDDVKKIHPNVDFEKMDKPSLHILEEMDSIFQSRFPSSQSDLALYDLHPKHWGDGRVVFPWNIAIGHIEPSCGTGTTTIGIAMTERGEIEATAETLRLFESGDGPTIGGPDITELGITTKTGKVVNSHFSHSLVEILATSSSSLSNVMRPALVRYKRSSSSVNLLRGDTPPK